MSQLADQSDFYQNDAEKGEEKPPDKKQRTASQEEVALKDEEEIAAPTPTENKADPDTMEGILNATAAGENVYRPTVPPPIRSGTGSSTLQTSPSCSYDARLCEQPSEERERIADQQMKEKSKDSNDVLMVIAHRRANEYLLARTAGNVVARDAAAERLQQAVKQVNTKGLLRQLIANKLKVGSDKVQEMLEEAEKIAERISREKDDADKMPIDDDAIILFNEAGGEIDDSPTAAERNEMARDGAIGDPAEGDHDQPDGRDDEAPPSPRDPTPIRYGTQPNDACICS